jgi:hypothetical protein
MEADCRMVAARRALFLCIILDIYRAFNDSPRSCTLKRVRYGIRLVRVAFVDECLLLTMMKESRVVVANLRVS